jgi:hypothetical protein
MESLLGETADPKKNLSIIGVLGHVGVCDMLSFWSLSLVFYVVALSLP